MKRPEFVLTWASPLRLKVVKNTTARLKSSDKAATVKRLQRHDGAAWRDYMTWVESAPKWARERASANKKDWRIV